MVCDMPDFQSRQTVSSTTFKKSLRSLSFYIVSRNRALTQVLQLTRQAHQPGCEPAQVPALAQIHRRRARRPPVRQPPRSQLVLDQPGLDLQVLRGHPCRPPAQGHPPRPAYQLDHKARSQGTLTIPPFLRFPHIVICPGKSEWFADVCVYNSTANPAASPPLARSRAVSARATATTRRRPAAARRGSGTIPSRSGATVKRCVERWVVRGCSVVCERVQNLLARFWYSGCSCSDLVL